MSAAVQRFRSISHAPLLQRQAAVLLQLRSRSTLTSVFSSVPQLEKVAETDKYVGMSGAQIFHEMMAEHNVTDIFGYPGGAILPVFDAIYESPHVRLILARHEQGAGHMAQGYARATGRPGVVLVTSGPGATNCVTPLQDALKDGTPLVVFSGQVATGVVGTDAFQEADVTGITRPCTKWNVLVRDIEELPRRINEAFHIAMTGRPGPVLVDLPKDVTSVKLEDPVCPTPYLPNYNPLVTADMAVIEEAAQLINAAEKPIIYCGQGVVQAGGADVLRELATKANVPVTTTLQALGAFDETHPLSLQMLGMHGSAAANYAMQSADLIIAIGARFDDRVTGNINEFAPEAQKAALAGRGGIIHFDISPSQMNKIVKATVAVEGDAKANMEQLLPLVQHRPRTNWSATISQWRERFEFRYRPSPDPNVLLPQQVVQELWRQTAHRDDVVITTGVGQHQMWAAQFYKYRHPTHWISSGGLGTMGFGLPSAIGAQVGVPHKLVVDIDGDGSFCMTGMEMLTAAEFGVNCKVLLLNNNWQGMIRQWQDLFYEERYQSSAQFNPDYMLLAKANHWEGVQCTTPQNLEEKMAEFLAAEGPTLGEFVVEKEEHCYPMVAAGRALDNMVLGPSYEGQ